LDYYYFFKNNPTHVCQWFYLEVWYFNRWLFCSLPLRIQGQFNNTIPIELHVLTSTWGLRHNSKVSPYNNFGRDLLRCFPFILLVFFVCSIFCPIGFLKLCICVKQLCTRSPWQKSGLFLNFNLFFLVFFFTFFFLLEEILN
jgi:hypothetical protein